MNELTLQEADDLRHHEADTSDPEPQADRAPLPVEEEALRLRGWLQATDVFTRGVDADILNATFGDDDVRDILKVLVSRFRRWLASLPVA